MGDQGRTKADSVTPDPVDVAYRLKAALISDGRVDAGNINVDTSASTKTVVLEGSVPTAEQRTAAEAIARDQAKGYIITNDLTVVPK